MVKRSVGPLLFLSAALALPAFAAPSLSVMDVSGPAGSTVQVPFTFNNDSNITAVGFDVLFDTAKISAVGPAVEGPALASSDHDVDSNLVSAGRFRVIVLSNSLAIIPSGQIVVVPFTIDEDLIDGSTIALTLSDVEMVQPNATVIGGTSDHGVITVQSGCPVPGDIAPDGVGNGAVTLLDFVIARRKALGTLVQNSHDALCGNVGPGNIVCTPTSGKISYCPTPNTTGNPISLIDVVIIRRLALQTYQIACVACDTRSSGAPARIVGDIAPRGTGDGRLDIADVVLALRTSVGLESASADTPLADVAPARREDGLLLADGNGIVDIGDVVLLLRTAVGLESLVWPERQIDVRLATPEPRVAFSVRVSGWPAHSQVLRVEGAECTGGEAGLDAATDKWGLACVTDPGVVATAGTIATVTHVGPRVSLTGLGVGSTLLSPDLTETEGLITLESR